MLTCPVALESLEPIPRRDSQVVERSGNLKLPQLPPRHSLDGDELLHPLSAGQSLGRTVPKREDHGTIVTRCVNNVTREYFDLGMPQAAFALTAGPSGCVRRGLRG